MKKKYVLFIAIILSFSSMIAQNAVVTNGGEATGPGGQVSFSIGQLTFQHEIGSNGSVLEGVQQPYEISVVGIDENPEIVLDAVVYPNPTMHSVVLRIDTENVTEAYDVLLCDVTGKVLKTLKVTDVKTLIEMETLPEGVYFLKIFNQNQSVKTFKIIKS